jgi:hypothetical protein
VSYRESEGTIEDRFHSIATHPASEATREAVVGEAVNKKGRLGAAVLVGPRLVLLAADAVFEVGIGTHWPSLATVRILLL